jgi:uncharacterized protein (UPF0548 family)
MPGGVATVFLLSRPSDEQIRNIIAAQRNAPFTYPFAGASRDDAPQAGYTRDHNRVRLGEGQAAFDRAVAAVKRWEMFNFGWMRLCWPAAPIEAGVTVAVLGSLPFLWTLNACRVVYTVDEDGPVRRFGFAYGTLPLHEERGEERFLIEWERADDSVWYDILTFSRPKSPLAKLGYPVARLLQKRFVRDSKRAMRRAMIEPRHDISDAGSDFA